METEWEESARRYLQIASPEDTLIQYQGLCNKTGLRKFDIGVSVFNFLVIIFLVHYIMNTLEHRERL